MHQFKTVNGTRVLIKLDSIISVWAVEPGVVGITLAKDVSYKVQATLEEIEKLLRTDEASKYLEDLHIVRKCFEAALSEGFKELVYFHENGLVDDTRAARLQDVWQRRLEYAYDYLCQVAPPNEGD